QTDGAILKQSSFDSVRGPIYFLKVSTDPDVTSFFHLDSTTAICRSSRTRTFRRRSTSSSVLRCLALSTIGRGPGNYTQFNDNALSVSYANVDSPNFVNDGQFSGGNRTIQFALKFTSSLPSVSQFSSNAQVRVMGNPNNGSPFCISQARLWIDRA